MRILYHSLKSSFCLCRINDQDGHDLKFKRVAKGVISKGFLDPGDGTYVSRFWEGLGTRLCT